MIIKADRYSLFISSKPDFVPDQVSCRWPCVHLFQEMGIFMMMFTPRLTLISNQFKRRSLGPRLMIGVPHLWSNSKLIFLILNNEKPWAPWRRKTEKLIDQLSLSFFKAAPYVQTRAEQKGIMATMRWYLISWHYPHYVRITQTSPDQTKIWEIRGSCPGHVTTGC